jgi:hypothetical protein
MQRLIVLLIFVCGSAWASDAVHPIEGYWGFEDVADMSCATNPTKIELRQSTHQIAMTWPKAVTYSDGGVWDAVTFAITASDGRLLHLRRERDGVRATIRLAPDLRTFAYDEANGNEGSTFTRCELASG